LFTLIGQRPLDSNERRTLPALLDTGADISTLPPATIHHLNLVPLDEIPIASYRGEAVLVATYLVHIQIGSWAIEAIEVIAGGEAYAILGRDVLNQFRLILDGPRAILEIHKDSA
jgi:predicted aspartyl protease